MDFFAGFDTALMDAIQSLHVFGKDAMDKLFIYLSIFGEENFLIMLLFTVYWSYNKKLGEFIIFSLGVSLSFNIQIKQLIGRDRPFLSELADRYRYVRTDGFFVSTENLHTSFSFPSGHAQVSGTYLTSIGLWFKNKMIWAVCIFLILGVVLSRIYLGVHYPSDTIAGAVIGVAVSYVLWKLFHRFYKKKIFLYLVVLFIILFGVVISPVADSYKMAGLTLGMVVGIMLESRYVRFDVEGTRAGKILRSVFGVALLLLLRVVLKMFFGENIYLDALRYFLMGVCAMFFWPWAFTKLKANTKI